MQDIVKIAIVSSIVIAGSLNLYTASAIDKNAQTEIETLLKTRDEAVQKKDSELFKTTQTSGAIGTSADGYMKYEKMETELVALRPYNDWTADKMVGFVKETFYKNENEKTWKSAYSMYIFQKVSDKWLVEKIIFEK